MNIDDIVVKVYREATTSIGRALDVAWEGMYTILYGICCGTFLYVVSNLLIINDEGIDKQAIAYPLAIMLVASIATAMVWAVLRYGIGMFIGWARLLYRQHQADKSQQADVKDNEDVDLFSQDDDK